VILAVDADAVLAGPPFDYPLEIVPGKVSLGYDLPDDPMDTFLGLLVERSMAHLPIDGQAVSGLVGKPPPLVVKVPTTHTISSKCETNLADNSRPAEYLVPSSVRLYQRVALGRLRRPR
jgi:hypothetical protein